MRILNFSIHLFIFINLTVCYACSRSRKKQQPQQQQHHQASSNLFYLVNNENYIVNSSKRNISFIDSTRTCNITNEPSKSLLYCYHNGKCLPKLIYLNKTHYSKDVFCLCIEPYSGDDCRENNSFIEARTSIIILSVLLAISLAIGGFFVYKYIQNRKKPSNKQQQEENEERVVVRKPILARNISKDTGRMVDSLNDHTKQKLLMTINNQEKTTSIQRSSF